MLQMKQIFGVTNVKISLATRQHGVIGVLMNIFLIKIISFKFPEINLLNYLANQIKQKEQVFMVRTTSSNSPNKYTLFGQIMSIDESLNISITYSFEKDQRGNKFDLMPKEFHSNNLLLAKWYGYEKITIPKKVLSKPKSAKV